MDYRKGLVPLNHEHTNQKPDVKPFDINAISVPLLDKKRLQGDLLADRLIAQVTASGDHSPFRTILNQLTRNDSYSSSLLSELPNEMNAHLNHYFQASSTLPEWVDWEEIVVGQKVFSKYVPLVMWLLQYKSLPLCYSCRNGVKALSLTGRLSQRYGNYKVYGRLVETAQMVVNTMTPDSFLSRGQGIITMQKVRLIHALVRHYLKSTDYNPKGWDVGELGEPINQEDMAGTLMAFGPMVLEGLERLNIVLSEEEKQGYSTCWRLIGHLTGIDEELLPETYSQGIKLSIEILKRQVAPSEEGAELTKSCLDLHKKLTESMFLENMPEFAVRFLLEDISQATGMDIGEAIGIKDAPVDYEKIVMIFSKFATIGIVNKTLLKGYHKFNSLSNVVKLPIPSALSQS